MQSERSTRSDEGKQSRDTFTSLNKTCRKLKISFWLYLQDRLSRKNQIPELSELILRRVKSLAPIPAAVLC